MRKAAIDKGYSDMALKQLPDIQYTAFDFELQRYMSQSESGGGLINIVEYAEPRWLLTAETRGYQTNGARPPDGARTIDSISAFWASLRGGLRALLVKHPVYFSPLLNRDSPLIAQQTGRLASITNANTLSITGVHSGLALSTGDYITVKSGEFYAVGMVVTTEGTGTTRTVEIEPRLPNYINIGATVYFDRIELIMRPISGSFAINGTNPYRTAKFQFMESWK